MCVEVINSNLGSLIKMAYPYIVIIWQELSQMLYLHSLIQSL